MDNASQSPKGSSLTPIIIGIALVVIVIIGVIVYQNNVAKSTSETVVEAAANPVPNQETGATSEYKDGTYTAQGNYISPGGEEIVGVSVTIENGIITDSTFTVMAERPTSVTMQENFAGGYKALVVGKNIDEVQLTKVAGSSLTPGGFMDALEKIKTQAQG